LKGLSAGRERALAYTLATTVALVWVYLVGRDLPPDTFHYHLYAGMAALHDRLTSDFFAAGPQSYLNPYSFVPLYLMVESGLPNVAIGVILTVTQSAILWLTYELAVLVYPARERIADRMVAPLAMALALLNPIVLQELGSSFNDLPIAVIGLAGWIALVYALKRGRGGPALLSGLLLGAAVALKLSNAFVVFAALPLVASIGARGPTRMRVGFAFGTGVGLAFVAVAGPWAWRLWRVFGNPFFPFMNSLFRSPDFITASLKHYRFVPDSLLGALAQPFLTIVPGPMVHTELGAPDGRYALLLLLALAWPGLTLWQSARRRAATPSAPPAVLAAARALPSDARVLALNLGAFVLGWALWLYASGNSRYFITLSCVGAVVTASLLARLLAARVMAYVALIFLALQCFQLWSNAEFRYNPVSWSGPWVDVTIPQRFLGEPYLYLTLDTTSQSFLATRLAPGSSFINIGGAYPLGPGAPGGERAAALIAQNRDRLRLLTLVAFVEPDGRPIVPDDALLNGTLERFALAVDRSDCDFLRVVGQGATIVGDSAALPGVLAQPGYLLTCRVVPSGSDPALYAAQQHQVDQIFDHAEMACPVLFEPRGTLSVHLGSAWSRIYFDTDGTLFISHGLLQASFPLRGDDAVSLGPAANWARAPQPLVCGRYDGHNLVKLKSVP
jgi:hypothetical protein